jgi:heparosan-N-sulfate-glucuronate 5-epimerase
MASQMDARNTLSKRSIDSLIWAMRAMRHETLGFRFGYPLEIDFAAGPKESLHYFAYSDSLSWSALRLDPDGIAQCMYPTTGRVYRPGFVAWYGLVNLGHYLRRRDQKNLEVFFDQVNWLERNAVLRQDGAVVWPHNFDQAFLKAPWVSANAQGLVISALIRAWRITNRPQLLELANASSNVFAIDISRGGLRDVNNGHTVYTELPGRAILDHFLNALLGLYDLRVETESRRIGELFTEGIEGLKGLLSTWDYRNKWSRYGFHGYLCPPEYHAINQLLLSVLARLSNDSVLADYAASWNPSNLSFTSRVEIFLGFVLTKNAARVRQQTWRQKRIRYNRQ